MIELTEEEARPTPLKVRAPMRVSDTCIDLEVELFRDGVYHAFTADANDTHEHGRALYDRAMAGEFGPIGMKPEPPKGSPPDVIA